MKEFLEYIADLLVDAAEHDGIVRYPVPIPAGLREDFQQFTDAMSDLALTGSGSFSAVMGCGSVTVEVII